MTREERAKEILEEIKINDDCLTQYIKGFDEALDVAIEALQFDIRKWADEHFIELVDKDVWADAKKALQSQAENKNRTADIEHVYYNGKELEQVDYPTVKAQADSSAEPYKGMTNGQVHDMLYQMLVELKDGEEGYGAERWWNSPYKGVAIPSATGHWKRISMDKYSEHAKYWYRCDRCGKDNLGNTDWCPNCGAKMVEPREVRDKG